MNKKITLKNINKGMQSATISHYKNYRVYFKSSEEA